MRPYEMTVILQPDLEDHKALSDELAEVVRELGGEVEKIDLWGKRKLAYPIKKQTDGFYVLYTYKLDAAQVRELERVLSLRPQVLRHLVVNLDA